MPSTSQRPTSILQNQSSKKRKKSHNWSTNTPDYDMNIHCEPKLPSNKARMAETPEDFFKLFFDDNILENIVDQTEIYGQHKNTTLNFSKKELYVLLGAILLSGYAKYPNKRMFWNSGEDTPKILLNSMRLNRFEQLIRHMHFNDNLRNDSTDKLYKLRPLIDDLNKNFREHGGLDEYLSIDESMIPYYGKHHAKQYIKGKPIRFGYKNWALCSNTGYMVSFDIYTGKSTNEKQFGLGGDVVISLVNSAGIPSNKGFKLYFDNYFTSITLLTHLAGNNICATGTIRANRMEGCPFPDKGFWNKSERGTYKFLSNGKLSLTQWKDNKVVTMATNFEDTSVTSAKRWCRETKSKKNISQPKVIHNYNQRMGGVDKMDGLVAAYRSRIRQRKWYWPIFQYLLDVSIVNAWLLMKKLKPHDPNCVNLLTFRRYIANSFLQTHGEKPSKYKASVPIQNVRFDGMNHLIQYHENDKKCKICGKNTKFICVKCNVGLHPKHCFITYHRKQ